MQTELIDIQAGVPVELKTNLKPASAVMLTNVAATDGRWLIAKTRPQNLPGFPIPTGQSVYLSLPVVEDSKIWLWSDGGEGRIALNQVVSDPQIAPGVSVIMSVGPSPVVLSPPPGEWKEKTPLAVYNASALDCFFTIAPSDRPPEPQNGLRMPAHAFNPHVLQTSKDQSTCCWVWSGWPAATLLISVSHPGWNLG